MNLNFFYREETWLKNKIKINLVLNKKKKLWEENMPNFVNFTKNDSFLAIT